MAVNIEEYNREVECTYKDERYSVRDNGAVMRHPRNGGRVRPLDNQWTFGKPNDKGYCQISSEIIHRIVAIAFLGEPPTNQHIVDHIDTNRQNNRPDNLRWLTKLENALNNPITRKRIEYICGSIEAFLADPSLLRNAGDGYADLEWMRAVTPEEAKNAYQRLSEWAKKENSESKGGRIGEWIFSPINLEENINYASYTESLTPMALQENWKTPCEFPLCPSSVEEPIYVYYKNLKESAVFNRNEYGETIILKFAISSDKNKLWILSKNTSSMKPWLLAEIRFEEESYIHKNMGSFFTEIGAEKRFTIIQGLDWIGEDSIDDYC